MNQSPSHNSSVICLLLPASSALTVYFHCLFPPLVHGTIDIMFDLHELNASNNPLLSYLQNQSPETLTHVAQNVSPEARQIIAQNIQSLLGMMPPQHFNVSITTDRENLAGLLGSAMMTGYFLKQMETRMTLEQGFSGSASLNDPQ